VVVGSTTKSCTTEARPARLCHHHILEIPPTGAGGYFGDAAWDHVGVAYRFRGIGYHITGPDSDVVGLGK
ncbi:hypothetical protein KI387_031579, partial [Taxus chinensis]